MRPGSARPRGCLCSDLRSRHLQRPAFTAPAAFAFPAQVCSPHVRSSSQSTTLAPAPHSQVLGNGKKTWGGGCPSTLQQSAPNRSWRWEEGERPPRTTPSFSRYLMSLPMLLLRNSLLRRGEAGRESCTLAACPQNLSLQQALSSLRQAWLPSHS